MSASDSTILIDEKAVPFKRGETILQAALEAGVYVPHLWRTRICAARSCKLCNVVVKAPTPPPAP